MTYYEFTAYINTLCENHPRIETFTIEDAYNVDDHKATMYPLCNLMVNNITVSESRMIYNIMLMAADRVGEINGDSTGKNNKLIKTYAGVTNIIDVHNDTLLSLADIVSYLRRNPEAFDYEVLGDAIFTPFSEKYSNLLGGWIATIDVNVPYDGNICAITQTVNP
jgi:hypothetical protein